MCEDDELGMPEPLSMGHHSNVRATRNNNEGSFELRPTLE